MARKPFSTTIDEALIKELKLKSVMKEVSQNDLVEVALRMLFKKLDESDYVEDEDTTLNDIIMPGT